ncbi:MAG: transketolase [Aquificaceae bacterium]|nr:transketolase [Aquificaceae bacterium]
MDRNLIINTIRALSIDQVEKAKSGHPGMPLGASHIIYLLFDKFMKFNPADPKWFNRDRFVLSAGHASAMLYTTLYVMGYDITIEDLKAFRQLDSKTPGHPESFLTPGVEATTGPLGQGLANAVGMAIAEKYLRTLFEKKGHKIIDHRTFALVSDGDLMEGISSEAIQLAGHMCLDRLLVIWDNNGISIDGPTSLSWSEDVLKRFEASGWYVDSLEDGYDLDALEAKITKAISQQKPSFLAVKTKIGYMSPLEGKNSVHGAPLGPENAQKTKENLGWNLSPFEVPKELLEYREQKIKEGQRLQNLWQKELENLRQQSEEDYILLERMMAGEIPKDLFNDLPQFSEPMATRQANQKVLAYLSSKLEELIGGSADLSESTGVYIKSPEKVINFGVREHAMGAILNGIAYHGGLLPYGSTFLVFSDYMRTPIRLSAMSGLKVIYIFSHDSIALGEDGPTHQPIEHLWSLRLIPNLFVIRPADANEVAFAWQIAIERQDGPSAIILSRQKLPIIDRSKFPPADSILKGAYALIEDENPELIIFSTGSEVHLSIEVATKLKELGIRLKLINMACIELFLNQPKDYIERILSPGVKKRIAIELSQGTPWHKFVGMDGLIIGLESFGKSAPMGDVLKHFGFTKDEVFNSITSYLRR